MAAKSTDLANAILDAIYRGESLDDWLEDLLGAGGDCYLALFTASPTASGGGTETTYGDYERRALARDGSDFGAGSSGRTSNLQVQTFPNATSGAGQQIVAFAIVSTASGAYTQLHYGPVSPAVVVVIGKGPEFEAGALEVIES
jgi:hypothetical protein